MRKERVKEEVPSGFDFRVTHRDPRTGEITHKNAYVAHIFGTTGSNERTAVYERPKGSGNCWDAQNNPAGRVVIEGEGKQARLTHKPEAQHIAWEAPLTEDQKLARSVAAQKAENAALKAELAALKAESEAKAPAKSAALNKLKES